MGKTLILTGFMGAGKSSVARHLGRRLGMDSVDLDNAIEAETGQTVAAIFEKEGEEAFRRLETAALAKLIAEGGKVVATGGGTLTKAENRRLMEGAVVINLHAPIETLLRRIRGSEDRRPLLRGGEGCVRALFETRRPLYEAVALQVLTDGKAASQVASEAAVLYLGKESGRG